MQPFAESTRHAALSADAPASPWWIDAAPVFTIAVGLILLRALAYLLFEQFGFDSDQAINGLMAKHLSEGRAFPLFFYGQTYMLAVESWVAVPFFWIAGATVAALRASLLLWNIAVAALLIVGLHRDGHLRWWTALVPPLFFLIAPPSLAKKLFEAQGGDIEPFLYIAALWFLRRRPLWFGVLLAIGFRNREFTLYAVPVLIALELASGELTRGRVHEWLLSLVMFLGVTELISALMPYADLAGPGTRGQLLGGFAGSQVGNLVDRLNWRPGELLTRTARIVPGLLGWFTGAAQVETSFPLADHRWVVWTAALLLPAAAVRLIWVMLRQAHSRGDVHGAIDTMRAALSRSSFAWYIFGVGVVAVVSFVAAKPTLYGYARYALLGLLVPVGLSGALLTLEPNRFVRRIVAGAVVAWAALAAADNVLLLARTIRHPPPNPTRELADRLIARQIPVAIGGYWDAYITTFVGQERALVASSDFVRIQEYQGILADHIRDARIVSVRPCAGGERVARWYLCSFP